MKRFESSGKMTAKAMVCIGGLAMGMISATAGAHDHGAPLAPSAGLLRAPAGYVATRPLVIRGLADRADRALIGVTFTNNPDALAPRSGRLIISTPRVGPGPTPRAGTHQDPGPLAYGVRPDDGTMIAVNFGGTIVTISPWQRIDGRTLRRLEDARLRWLHEQGYTSGVRTAVNDLHIDRWLDREREQSAQQWGGWAQHVGPMPTLPWDPASFDDTAQGDSAGKPTNARQIQPRATIKLPAEMPRFRKRMDVRAKPACVTTFAGVAGRTGHSTGDVQVVTVSGAGNDALPARVVVRRAKPAQAPTAQRVAQATGEVPGAGASVQ